MPVTSKTGVTLPRVTDVKKPDSTPDDTPTADAESHIQKLVEEFEKRLRQEMPMGPVTLEEIERRADRLGEQVKEAVQKELLDLAGTGYVGSSDCSCQGAPGMWLFTRSRW